MPLLPEHDIHGHSPSFARILLENFDENQEKVQPISLPFRMVDRIILTILCILKNIDIVEEIDLDKLRLSGRVGPVVAYTTKYGTEVLRKHVIPKDPKTPKQLAYRMKFALVSSVLSPFSNIIKDGYNQKRGAYRAVLSKALHDAVEGEYPNFSINFSKIQLTDGKLKLPTKIDASIQNNSLIITWNPQTKGQPVLNRSDDQLNIICLDESTNEVFVTYNAAKRGDGEVNIDINKLLKRDSESQTINSEKLHFWLYLSSIDGKYNSESRYLGV